jgi:restriction system protein
MKYDVARTPLTGDYGADLIVKKDNETIVVQCKKYGEEHKVGAPDVQRTLGSMYRYNANKAILITTSDFTKQAKIQGAKAPIELWNKRKIREQYLKVYLIPS